MKQKKNKQNIPIKKNNINKIDNSKFYDTYDFTFKERFLRYVKYDTQSDLKSTTSPSTDKQKILLKLLLAELKELKIESEYDDKGVVYAKISKNTSKQVEAIGFISHVDTNFDVSGKDVNPIIHEKYNGKDIILPKDNQIIKVKDNPALKKVIGHTIITTNGSTLLGADDKAGVSEIMDAARYIVTHPEFKHGDIMLAFTTDEEVGRGTKNFDIKKFGAKFAYTVDGENVGEIESVTFNAKRITLTILGHNTHTGYAKNKMINATKIAAEFISTLPKNLIPEKTDNKQGFIHVNNINGNVESATLEILLRDFNEKTLLKYELIIRKNISKVIKKYCTSNGVAINDAKYELKIENQYKNMGPIIDKYPKIMNNAIKAMTNLGIKYEIKIIRGGTDGCELSRMGLPTPNIFCGEHNFHSKTEWVSIQEMELAVKTILEICGVWEKEA